MTVWFYVDRQIADIMAATELEQPSMAGYDVTQGRFTFYKTNLLLGKHMIETIFPGSLWPIACFYQSS